MIKSQNLTLVKKGDLEYIQFPKLTSVIFAQYPRRIINPMIFSETE